MFVPGAFRDDLGQEMPFAYVDKYRRGVLNGYSVYLTYPPKVCPSNEPNHVHLDTKKALAVRLETMIVFCQVVTDTTVYEAL